MLTWVKNNRGTALSYLVIAIAFGVPLLLRACGLFAGETPSPMAVCARAVCAQ